MNLMLPMLYNITSLLAVYTLYITKYMYFMNMCKLSLVENDVNLYKIYITSNG